MRTIISILLFLFAFKSEGQIINASQPYRPFIITSQGISLIAQTSKASPTGVSVTTDAINTTGASLIVVCIVSVYYNEQPVQDNQGNTWTSAGEIMSGGSYVRLKIFYKYAPTTNASHTFSTVGGYGVNYASMIVFAFSGTTGTSYESNNYTQNGYSPLSTGNVTPSTNGQVLVALLGSHYTTAVSSVTSGFTPYNVASSPNNFFASAAYYIQQTAGAKECTFTWSPSQTWSGTALIANFK